jgi:hypothetical protein
VHACVDNSGEAANQENFCRSACLVAEPTNNNHHHHLRCFTHLPFPIFQALEALDKYSPPPLVACRRTAHVRTAISRSMHESEQLGRVS